MGSLPRRLRAGAARRPLGPATSGAYQLLSATAPVDSRRRLAGRPAAVRGPQGDARRRYIGARGRVNAVLASAASLSSRRRITAEDGATRLLHRHRGHTERERQGGDLDAAPGTEL